MAFNPSIQMSVSSKSLGSAHSWAVAGQGICGQFYFWFQGLLLQGVGLEQFNISLPGPRAEEQSRYLREVKILCFFVLLRTGQNPGDQDGTFLKENCQDRLPRQKEKSNQKGSLTCDATREERW